VFYDVLQIILFGGGTMELRPVITPGTVSLFTPDRQCMRQRTAQRTTHLWPEVLQTGQTY
jgi:hypothetical protein